MIYGVKRLVEEGVYLVRELPFSPVKSANAKGSDFPGLAAPDLPFSVACGPTAATRSLERESEFAGVAPAAIPGVAAATSDAVGLAEESCAADASAAGDVEALPLDSRSATRFSSSSTRSSSQRSRSVNGAGASTFAATRLAGVSLLPLSSVDAKTSTPLP